MRKYITQKDQFGCGVACVAFVLGVNYKKAILLFKNGDKKSKNTGFLCKEIVIPLNSNIYKYGYIKQKIQKNIYEDKTIVFIKKSKLYPFGDYLVRSGKYWMDPWLNFKENRNIIEAKSGFRKRLPGKPIYYIKRKALIN